MKLIAKTCHVSLDLLEYWVITNTYQIQGREDHSALKAVMICGLSC